MMRRVKVDVGRTVRPSKLDDPVGSSLSHVGGQVAVQLAQSGDLRGDVLMDPRIEPEFGRSRQVILPAFPITDNKVFARVGNVVPYRLGRVPTLPEVFWPGDDPDLAVRPMYQDPLAFLHDIGQHAEISQEVDRIKAGDRLNVRRFGSSHLGRAGAFALGP